MAEVASEHSLAYEGNLGALKLRFDEAPTLAVAKDLVTLICSLKLCFV